MAKPVILPKFDMMMETGVIVRWLAREGHPVREGDPLVEVETDKVNMEIEAPAAGILTGIRAAPGETVPVATVIAYILQPGESLPDE
ncbi:MAG TPA: lipoyl domain-containing protein [bacterium]|jgi:pyruvate dehydrogenase E2 component (dihydrolipoamide acetyltransferase)|nr:lipoyl domain-containing protein [bacterium]